MKKAIDWFNKQKYGVVVRSKETGEIIESMVLFIDSEGEMHVGYKGNTRINCLRWSKILKK